MATPIPRPPGVFLLGNIFDIDPNNSWASLKTLADKYGEIFQIKVLGKTLVFVASVSLAQEICDERRFRKFVGGPIVQIRRAVHDSLFTAYDSEPSWEIAHRILAPQLSSESVGAMFDGMCTVADELIKRWGNLTFPERHDLRPFDELNKFHLQAMTLTLFGQKIDCLDRRDGPAADMIQAMEDATSEAMKRGARPALLNWLMGSKKLDRATAAMRSWAAAIVQYRQDHPTSKKDLLYAIMYEKGFSSQDNDCHRLADSQVIDEIITMAIGGSTVPCVLASALYFVGQNPHVLAKIRLELDEIVGAGPFTFDHLGKLDYLSHVLNESLRLSFAAPGFNVEPKPSADKSPIQLSGGRYEIAHDQAMIIVLAGVNRDPTWYEDPDRFNPERRETDPRPGAVLPDMHSFGNGKRECAGKRWARQCCMVALAKILGQVDYVGADPEYELSLDGWFNLRPVDFGINILSTERRPRAEIPTATIPATTTEAAAATTASAD